jgi:hypothetical protein
MDAETISKLVQDNLPDLQSVALDAIKKNIATHLGWEIPAEVRKVVAEFMAKEIAPAVAAHLASEKGAIIEAVKVAVGQIGVALGEQMVKNATEALTSYSGKDIVSKLVGGR